MRQHWNIKGRVDDDTVLFVSVVPAQSYSYLALTPFRLPTHPHKSFSKKKNSPSQVTITSRFSHFPLLSPSHSKRLVLLLLFSSLALSSAFLLNTLRETISINHTTHSSIYTLTSLALYLLVLTFRIISFSLIFTEFHFPYF